MALRETDTLPVRLTTPGAVEQALPRVGASQALPQGRVQMATMPELRAILGLPEQAGQTIASGVAALALTDTTNIATSVAGAARFQRIGSTVFVSGSCTIDTTLGAPTTTVLNIALPVGSTFAAATDLSGTIVGGTDGLDQGRIIADTGSDDAEATWEANHTDVQTYIYQFSYTII